MNCHENGKLREKHREASTPSPAGFLSVGLWPVPCRIQFAKEKGVDLDRTLISWQTQDTLPYASEASLTSVRAP